MSESNVDRLTDEVRRLAADFVIKPEERIREGAMATELGVSRTPLREALNRLVAEGFLTFRGGQGFFCRALTPDRIVELYEARCAIECEGLRLTLDRASDAAIAELAGRTEQQQPEYERSQDAIRLLELDEAFHRDLLALCGNAELSRMLDNINGRIRYVRMTDLKALRAGPESTAGVNDHLSILAAVSDRDAGDALPALRSHIEMRQEKAVQAVGNAFAQIYVPQE